VKFPNLLNSLVVILVVSGLIVQISFRFILNMFINTTDVTEATELGLCSIRDYSDMVDWLNTTSVERELTFNCEYTCQSYQIRQSGHKPLAGGNVSTYLNLNLLLNDFCE
jgi:hypothetical protein